MVDSLLPERFNLAVREQGVRPVGQPQVTELKLEEGSPFHVKAVFEFVPGFSVEGYQDVTVEKPSVRSPRKSSSKKSSSSASRARLSSRSKRTVRWRMATGRRSLIRGQVEGDAEATPVAGEDALVEIGGKDTVEAFSNALRGAKPGQELKAEVIYPADYSRAEV